MVALDGVLASTAAGTVTVMNPTGVVVAVVCACSEGTSEASSAQAIAVARGRIRREEEVFIDGYLVWIWLLCKGNSIKNCSEFVKVVKAGADGVWFGVILLSKSRAAGGMGAGEAAGFKRGRRGKMERRTGENDE